MHSKNPKQNPNSEAIEELIEQLADIEHQRWSDWMKYMFDSAVISGDDTVELRTLGFPTKQFERWKEQMETDYEYLTNKEQESDREQVRRYLPLIEQSLTQTANDSWNRALEEVKRKVMLSSSIVDCKEVTDLINKMKI